MNSTRRERYNANRRERQTKARQAVLINEYIYTKYFDIYREAASYYNQLNVLYPTKRDLRRCQEFKKWKRETTGQTNNEKSSPRRVQRTARNRYYITYHPDIPLDQHTDSAESTDLDTNLSQQHLSNSPDQIVADTTESSKLPTNPGEKVMELRIPLLKSSVATETLQIVTQQTLGNSIQVAAQEIVQDDDHDIALYPSLNEELPEDIISRIINELQADPELKSVMDDVEQDMEFELMGNDLESPEHDRLQEELQNITRW